jgi:hypothetical protein
MPAVGSFDKPVARSARRSLEPPLYAARAPTVDSLRVVCSTSTSSVLITLRAAFPTHTRIRELRPVRRRGDRF